MESRRTVQHFCRAIAKGGPRARLPRDFWYRDVEQADASQRGSRGPRRLAFSKCTRQFATCCPVFVKPDPCGKLTLHNEVDSSPPTAPHSRCLHISIQQNESTVASSSIRATALGTHPAKLCAHQAKQRFISSTILCRFIGSQLQQVQSNISSATTDT